MKKSKKKNVPKVFTEEELRQLQLDDDGMLEVGFTGEEDKSKKKPMPGKTDKPNKKISEMDKRVAAILKKLDLENDSDDEEEDDDTIDSNKFNELIEAGNNAIEEELASVASTEQANKIRKQFGISDKLVDLKKVANKSSKFFDYMLPGILQNQIEDLREELEDSADPDERAKIRRKIKSLKKRIRETEQTVEARRIVNKYNMVSMAVEDSNNSKLEDDIRELYQKYGNAAIKKLLTAEVDDDEEEAI